MYILFVVQTLLVLLLFFLKARSALSMCTHAHFVEANQNQSNDGRVGSLEKPFYSRRREPPPGNTSPGGGTAIGFGAGALGAALQGGQNGAPRITRRMKSDVRRVYNMSMGNADITAQILNQMGTYPKIRFDAATVFFILTKRFRNDGPVVTKAAVRKTKSTLRRMKGVVDMYNSVCKPTTRRAPARRAAP